MIDRDRTVAGIAGAVAAGVGDFLMTGGDMVIALLALLLQDGGILVSFVTYLARYAERVAWIPAAPIDQLVDVVLLLVMLGMAYRLLNAWLSRWRNS